MQSQASACVQLGAEGVTDILEADSLRESSPVMRAVESRTRMIPPRVHGQLQSTAANDCL